MINSFSQKPIDCRRRAIVEAARGLFIEQGFERTTLSAIVEQAGGSLATIYKLFGNKEGLLDAVVFEKLTSFDSIVSEISDAGYDPAETLRRMGKALHEQCLDPVDIALVRLVIARSIEDEEFAHRFFELKANRTRKALEAVFAAWQAKGLTLDDEPAVLAEIFLGLIVSDLQNEAISHGANGRPSEKQAADRIEFFLRGAGLVKSGQVADG